MHNKPLRPIAPISAILLILLISVTSLWAEDPVLHAEDYSAPGSVLQLIISGDPVDNITVSLQDERERTLSRTEGFQWRTPTGRSISVALLGIPSTALPGRHKLVVKADQGRAEWHLEKVLNISDRVFPEQVIRLSDKMNTLYTDDSERKKLESRELWTVLTAHDPRAVYHIGPFIIPLVQSTPTAGYGDRRRYRMPDGSESSSVHFGRDLWAETGTPVLAAGRGRVVLAAERFLTGNTIVLEHLPGVHTMYSHMDSIDVRIGQMVEQGTPIGTVGQTGFATGEHLHWEMRVGATPVNPELFIDAPLLDTDALMGKM
ncbi:MAG: M23 family metallopeptidase [Spirochaetaceae bacterium]|nr:M23 family metallopeptidase [Spirochaetaceae bacterium]MDT8297912.1 M23 family metallopeptidase [Spirochaetaceae bacterium]